MSNFHLKSQSSKKLHNQVCKLTIFREKKSQISDWSNREEFLWPNIKDSGKEHEKDQHNTTFPLQISTREMDLLWGENTQSSLAEIFIGCLGLFLSSLSIIMWWWHGLLFYGASSKSLFFFLSGMTLLILLSSATFRLCRLIEGSYFQVFSREIPLE